MFLLIYKNIFKNWIRVSCLKMIPKNLFSYLFGKIICVKLPKIIVKIQIKCFIYWFKIDLLEIKKPLNKFASLQDFFVRELKSNARKINVSKDSVVAPCDGFWGQSGKVRNGKLFQIKGHSYRLDSLLGDIGIAEKLENGQFATFYLSPYNYHRFHMPIDGKIFEVIHIPGRLWPVNLSAVNNIDKLFCINERVVMMIKKDVEFKNFMIIVAVGATMVGKIKLNLDNNLITNQFNSNPSRYLYNYNCENYKKGDEIGRFEFGSTLVMIASENLLILNPKKNGKILKMGTKIGILK